MHARGIGDIYAVVVVWICEHPELVGFQQLKQTANQDQKRIRETAATTFGKCRG